MLHGDLSFFIMTESVIEMLSSDTPMESEEQQKVKAKRLRNRKIKKYLLIGSGTLLGGAILGLTGGLVAPYMAIGATTIIGMFKFNDFKYGFLTIKIISL